MTDEASAPNHDPAHEKRQIEFPGRRSFLGALVGIGTAAVGLLLGVPLVRFALYPLFARTTQTGWSDLGSADGFAQLTTPVQTLIAVAQQDGWREIDSKKAVYVTKTPGGELEVLSAVCPHLGCEVPWDPQRKEFVCPCHGSIFAADGSRISGPTPRAMDSLPARIVNGRLMVRYEYFRQLAPYKEEVS